MVRERVPRQEPLYLRSGSAQLPRDGAHVAAVLFEERDELLSRAGRAACGRCFCARVIKKVFEGHKDALYEEPNAARIEGCSSKWGSGSGSRAPIANKQ